MCSITVPYLSWQASLFIVFPTFLGSPLSQLQLVFLLGQNHLVWSPTHDNILRCIFLKKEDKCQPFIMPNTMPNLIQRIQLEQLCIWYKTMFCGFFLRSFIHMHANIINLKPHVRPSGKITINASREKPQLFEGKPIESYNITQIALAIRQIGSLNPPLPAK